MSEALISRGSSSAKPGSPKRGDKSAGVQRQYSGTIVRTKNCQLGVLMAYTSQHGRTLIDWERYRPQGWCDDTARRAEAAVPSPAVFATKPALVLAMLGRAPGGRAGPAAPSLPGQGGKERVMSSIKTTSAWRGAMPAIVIGRILLDASTPALATPRLAVTRPDSATLPSETNLRSAPDTHSADQVATQRS